VIDAPASTGGGIRRHGCVAQRRQLLEKVVGVILQEHSKRLMRESLWRLRWTRSPASIPRPRSVWSSHPKPKPMSGESNSIPTIRSESGGAVRPPVAKIGFIELVDE
jgi:hypothetical protein